MTIKALEKPIITLAEDLAFKNAKLVDNQYRLDINELNDADKLELIGKFMDINANLNQHLQEYLNDACMDRMYAETQPFGEWNE